MDMSAILIACVPCCCRHWGPALSYPTICTLCSTSSRYNQHTSRINTAMSSLSTQVMFLLAASMRQKIVVNSMPKCSVVTSLLRQDLSCIERRQSLGTHAPGSANCSSSTSHTVCMFLLLQMFCAEVSNVRSSWRVSRNR